MDKVQHFEIPADDIGRAQKFYKTVFGWKMDPQKDMDYTLVSTVEIDEKTRTPKEPGAINGGMAKREMLQAPTVTITVANIDEAMKRIMKNGGKALGEKQQVGDMGWSAYFKDSEGNVIGLWQSSRKMM